MYRDEKIDEFTILYQGRRCAGASRNIRLVIIRIIPAAWSGADHEPNISIRGYRSNPRQWNTQLLLFSLYHYYNNVQYEH